MTRGGSSGAVARLDIGASGAIEGIVLPVRDVIAYASTGSAKYNLGLASNPLGYSPTIDEQFENAAIELGYDPSSYPKLKGVLEKNIARFYGIDPENVYVDGKGAVGVITSIFETGLIPSNQFLVVPESTFPAAAVAAKNRGIGIVPFKLDNDFRIDFEKLKKAIRGAGSHGTVGAVFICNPNNPTGIAEPTANIIDLANTFPNTPIIVSEANMELVSDAARKRIGGSLLDAHNLSKLPANILVVRSFSKAYGLVDDRMGYAVGDARIIHALTMDAVPFAVSDRQVIRASLALRDQAHVENCRRYMAAEMPKIISVLEELDFHSISKSDSNLILAGVPDYFGNHSDELAQRLAERDCSVVSCGAEFGSTVAGKYIRLTPSTPQHNADFVKILRDVCEEKKAAYYANIRKDCVTERSFASVIGTGCGTSA
jgi:histidinol-phosphate aminotransferase